MRNCPISRTRCENPLCERYCARTQTPKGDPWYKPGELGHVAAKEPCRECPLRRDSIPGYLGGYSWVNYLEIMHSDADIACHMSPGFHQRDLSRQRACTGVAAYRANVSKLPRGGKGRESVLLIGQNREDFFGSAIEFAIHHRSALK